MIFQQPVHMHFLEFLAKSTFSYESEIRSDFNMNFDICGRYFHKNSIEAIRKFISSWETPFLAAFAKSYPNFISSTVLFFLFLNVHMNAVIADLCRFSCFCDFPIPISYNIWKPFWSSESLLFLYLIVHIRFFWLSYRRFLLISLVIRTGIFPASLVSSSKKACFSMYDQSYEAADYPDWMFFIALWQCISLPCPVVFHVPEKFIPDCDQQKYGWPGKLQHSPNHPYFRIFRTCSYLFPYPNHNMIWIWTSLHFYNMKFIYMNQICFI